MTESRIRQIIETTYATGIVVGCSGRSFRLSSAVDPVEGSFLYSLLVAHPAFRRTLEIGCAFGLSSLHICAALADRPGASHTIIDPFQHTDWDGAGVRALELANIDFFKLTETRSEFALPALLATNEGQFDFAFVDGWHTFDHTMLDCFYATRLLRVGGILAIDDVSLPSVSRVVNYLLNYPCFQEHGAISHPVAKTLKKRAVRLFLRPFRRASLQAILSPALFQRIFADQRIRLIALKKTREDHRDWDWDANLL